MHLEPTREAGLQRLAAFLPNAGYAYANNRNHDDGARISGPNAPWRSNVSQLSPWLHAGLIKEAEVIDAVLAQHSPAAAEKFIAEVFWRIYFKGYLEQRPAIWPDYVAGRDRALGMVAANAGLQRAYTQAVEGRTGIEAFDHWARELVETGYLHNHARMWFASIWIFTLKLDWQLGADFFLRYLVDGDAASNTLSWRWVGGLHTKGKTYLARADNIARYTANHPAGPLAARGLADDAPSLEEAIEHQRQRLNLPLPLAADGLKAPYALILHDEAASHVPLDLPVAPALVIAAARPEARSSGEVGEPARSFAHEAVRSGMLAAAQQYACEAREWPDGTDLAAILDAAGIDRVVVPYLPTGWTLDALMPQLTAFGETGRLTIVLDNLNRATWPHARAGFFAVKKSIGTLLRELDINGARQGELSLS